MGIQETTLEDLQAGDVAYIAVTGSGPRHYLKVVIAKVTTTQIVTTDGERYRRTDGNLIGERVRWTYYTLCVATPELAAMYQRQENLSLISGAAWKNLSDEQLEVVARVLRGE